MAALKLSQPAAKTFAEWQSFSADLINKYNFKAIPRTTQFETLTVYFAWYISARMVCFSENGMFQREWYISARMVCFSENKNYSLNRHSTINASNSVILFWNTFSSIEFFFILSIIDNFCFLVKKKTFQNWCWTISHLSNSLFPFNS